jgi:hypothetical protein
MSNRSLMYPDAPRCGRELAGGSEPSGKWPEADLMAPVVARAYKAPLEMLARRAQTMAVLSILTRPPSGEAR